MNGLTPDVYRAQLGRGPVAFGLVRRVAAGSSVIQVEGNNYLDQDPLIPSPRTSPENGLIRVVGVESEPLTDEQMAAAIRALSRLIASYMAANDKSETFAENRPSKAHTA